MAFVSLLFFFISNKITFTNFFQKLGFIPLENSAKKSYVHIHICSIGEWNTFLPFLVAFEKKTKENILITYFNQDLSSTILESNLVDKCFFLPLENPLALFLMIKIYRIKYTIISEAESWPGLLFMLRFFRKKTFLVNAALFVEEFHRYQKLRFFFRTLFNLYHKIYPTSSSFLERFSTLGVQSEKLLLGGNFKLANNTKKSKEISFNVSTSKKIIILASFHFKEIKAIFHSLKEFFKNPQYVFFIAPRSLLEKAKWDNFLKSQQINFKLRSSLGVIDNRHHLFIDSYGELASFYQKASLVIMGGSFIPIGGHNFLEAIRENKPIILGPYMEHFSDLVEIFRKELFFSSSENLKNDLTIILNNLANFKENTYQKKLNKNQKVIASVLSSILQEVKNA